MIMMKLLRVPIMATVTLRWVKIIVILTYILHATATADDEMMLMIIMNTRIVIFMRMMMMT